MDDGKTVPQRHCSVKECGKKHYAKGFCAAHYMTRHRKAGLCSIEGCIDGYYAKGFCKRHYMKRLRHDDPQFDPAAKRKLAYVKDGIGYIPLTKGLWAMVDECDFERIAKRTWSARKGVYTWYGTRRGGIGLHEEVLGVKAGFVVDHCDGNGMDNRNHNLRHVTYCQNGENRRMMKNNTSGVRGVSLVKRTGRWVAYITKDRKRTQIGNFKSKEEARAARLNAEERLGFLSRKDDDADLAA